PNYLTNLKKVMKKLSYFILAFLAVSLIACNGKKEKDDQEDQTEDRAELIEKAKKIHENVITIDTHVDIDVGNFTSEKNYTQNLPIQVDLPKMKEGGLDAIFLIVYTGQGELNEEGY